MLLVLLLTILVKIGDRFLYKYFDSFFFNFSHAVRIQHLMSAN